MRDFPEFTTKAGAVAHVTALGFTVHEDTGASGDGGYGSREYFTTPTSPRNDFGVPTHTMTVSKVGRVWLLSEFGKP